MRCSEHQMTIGELIKALKRKRQEAPVTFGFGYLMPDGIHSYRGFYEDLAIGYSEHKGFSVAELVKKLDDVLGTSLQGYKGGEFLMHDETPVWADNHNNASSNAIVDVVEVGGYVWLKTEFISV